MTTPTIPHEPTAKVSVPQTAPAGAPLAAMTHTIVTIDQAAWREQLKQPAASVRRAVAATLRHVAFIAPVAERVEIGVTLADDARVRELNRDYRGQDKATNVLAFPTMAAAEIQAAAAAGGADPPPLVLGDIILAYETVAGEARAFARPLEHHLLHLIVHGSLHLLGLDHQTPDEAEEMEREEREILATFGIDDPYLLPADPLRDSIEQNS